MTDIIRNLGGVVSWTDATSGFTGYRTELSSGTAVQVPYTESETAIRNTTITFQLSTVHTGVGNTIKIYPIGNRLWVDNAGTLTPLTSA